MAGGEMPRRILSLSQNTHLLLSRNDMLAAAGYSVSSPRTPEDALNLLRTQRFDAVICGHSIEKPRRDKLLAQIAAIYPELPLVFVFVAPGVADASTAADISVDVTEPTNLVKALRDLFSVE
jgi:DNA-binding NtrC family response regulator